jgi:aminoglycoside phosphotransferase (APT) family kinase protein
VEYCYGEPLDSIIMRSINSGDTSLLYGKLTALAWFLATVHNNSARPVGVDFNGVCVYAGCVLDGLKNIIDHGEKNYFLSLIERWKQKPEMWQDQEVLVHGDATPSNFFFGDGMNVITFDLERVNRTDRVFDTGRLAGELQHCFLRSTGNKYAAEPYIGHFLREYCCHFPDREAAFRSVTARVPFYMAVNLLRIARNSYLDMEYRRKLVNEAKITFERGF